MRTMGTSVLLIALGLLCSSAFAQDAIGVSVAQVPSSTESLTIAAPCRFTSSLIRCTDGFPGNCGCGPFPPRPPTCACPFVHAPVCGTNNRTYGSSCAAKCAGANVACQGNCPCSKPPSGCACPRNFAPVCGVDNVTYSNSCNARCAGASIACNGGCPCKKPPPSGCEFSNGRFFGSCEPPSTPSTPSEINNFLDECVEKGAAASVAAARAACSTLKNKCPAVRPASSLATKASFAASSVANPADALLEKVLEGACLSEAENACKSKAFDNIRDSTCSRLLNSGPATFVPGCQSLKDAVNIFNGEVNKLCRN